MCCRNIYFKCRSLRSFFSEKKKQIQRNGCHRQINVYTCLEHITHTADWMYCSAKCKHEFVACLSQRKKRTFHFELFVNTIPTNRFHVANYLQIIKLAISNRILSRSISGCIQYSWDEQFYKRVECSRHPEI